MTNLKIDTNSLSTSLGIINNTKSTFTNSYNSVKNISSVLANQEISVSFVQILNNLKNNQSQINKIITDIDSLITNYEKLNKQINTLGGTVVSTSPLTASSTDQNIEITTNSQSITKKDIDKAKEEYDEIKKSVANQEEQIAYLEGTHYGQNITDWDEEDREKLTVYQRNLDKLKDTQAQKYNVWSNLNNSFYKVDAEYNTSKLKKDAEAALFRGNEAATLEETKIQAQLNHILTYTEGTVANLTDNQFKSIGENYTNKAEKLRNELINVEKEIAKLKDSIKTEFLHDREKDATSNLKQLEKQKLVLESNLSSVYAMLEVLGLNDTNYRYEDVIQDTENNIAKENIIITEESINDLKNTIADLEDQLTIAQNKLKEYNNQPLHERGDTSTLEEQISSIQEQIKTSEELLKTSKMGYYEQLSTNENYELESKCKTQKISDYNFDNKTIKINGIVTSLSNIDLFTLVDYTINQNNLELYQLVLENASIPDGVKLNKYKNDYLPYLKDNEKEQYYYILNTKGLAQAEEYLADQEDNIANRKGYLEAQEILNGLDNNNSNIFDTIVLAIKGASGGLDNFYDGISNLVFADGQLSSDDYRSMYLLQGLIDKYGEETVFGQYSDTKVSSVMIATYEIYTSIGNMMPSMIAGVIGGLIGTPALGSALMFASTAGNSKEKALQMGYTEDEANLYGLLTGLSETALEYFLGGIPGLSKLSEIKGITAILINILKEGREESIQEVIDWLLQGIISGEFQELSWENVIKSGLYGMITAGLMSGGTVAIESIPVDSVYLLERYTKEELEIINDYIIKNPELTKSVLQAIGQNGEIDLSNVDTTQIVNLLAKIKPDFVEQIINTKEPQTTNNHNVEQIVEKVNDEVELSTNNEIVEPNITIPKIVEKAKIISKRIGGGIGLAGLAFLDIGITTINPILGGIFTLATLLPGNLLFGNKGLYASDIKDSSFSVLKSKKVLGQKVYYISQNLSLSSILKAKLVNNQQQFFIIEALNCFQQMKTRNADGNKIKYGTKSQGYTKLLLQHMERGGYITNFNSDKVKSSNLTLERFLFGVKQRKKPIIMHEMTFELTDKPINSQFINEMITKYKIDITNYNQIQKGDMTILKLKTFKLLKDKIAGLFNKNNNNVESIATEMNQEKISAQDIVTTQNIESTSQIANNTDITNIANLDTTIDLMAKGFIERTSYTGFDYVIEAKQNLSETISKINSINDGKSQYLIVMDNTTNLTLDQLQNIPDNVKIRVMGAYSADTLSKYSSDTANSLVNKATYTASELTQIMNIINNIESNISENWNQYEKAYYIYDYLSNKLDYDSAADMNARAGTLVNSETRGREYDSLMGLIENRSTCAGFAYMYQELLTRQGIKCKTVGTMGANGHAFNTVTIDNNTFLVDNVFKYVAQEGEGTTGFGVVDITPKRYTRGTAISSIINSSNETIMDNIKTIYQVNYDTTKTSSSKSFSNILDISEYFKDKNLYLYDLFQKKLKLGEIDYKEFSTIKKILTSNNEKTVNEILNKLSPSELSLYQKFVSNSANSITENWISSLNNEEKFALREYAELFGAISSKDVYDLYGINISKSYISINELIRLGYDVGNKYLDSAIEKFGSLNDKIIVYRGIGLSSLLSYFKNIDITNLQNLEGQTFTDKAYMSTSLLESRAYDKDVLFEITVSNDENYGAFVESQSNLGYSQLEFLIKKGTTLMIENVYQNAENKIIIKAKTINN